MIRIDCHSHTCSSWDTQTDHRRYLEDAVAAGLDAVFVTDHHTFAGIDKLRALDPPFRVFPGVEILTADGEILAYFLDELPPERRPLEETIAFVHARGGVVSIPHPFALTAHLRIKRAKLPVALELADAVESLNARNESVRADDMAREMAARYGKPITAGSDAHLPGCVGRAFLEMEDFTGPAEFLANLRTARAVLRKRSTLTFNIVGLVQTMLRTGRIHPKIRFRPLLPSARRSENA